MTDVLVFLSGPLTKGLCSYNVRRTNEVAVQLREAGFVPFVPHLFWFTEVMFPHEERFWLDWDLAMVRRCDVVLRLEGTSPGGDGETTEALDHGIPVLYEVDGGLQWLLDHPHTTPAGIQADILSEHLPPRLLVGSVVRSIQTRNEGVIVNALVKPGWVRVHWGAFGEYPEMETDARADCLEPVDDEE